jgi:hypothetical protein
MRARVRERLMPLDLTSAPGVEVRFAQPSGLPGESHPSVALTRAQAIALRNETPHGVSPRRGGMVYLTGGELRFRTSAEAFADAQLDVCGRTYCLRFANPALNPLATGPTVALPFSPSPLFTVTWQLTYQRQVESLYLSINPRKDALRNNTFGRAPTTKLLLDPPPAQRVNDIVTSGGVDRTELGPILLDADIAFKSGGLGFDVRAGHPIDKIMPVEDLPDPLSEDRERIGPSRWCRSAWQSSAQDIQAVAGGIRLSGPAIHAEAEAMRLVDGDLVPYPAGGWCGGTKAIANRLNAQLKNRTAPTAIKQLDHVGSIQNLAAFARRNHMTTTAAFDQTLVTYPARPRPPLPKWTSGIRSHTRPVVQLDYRHRADGTPRRMLVIYTDDLAAIEPMRQSRLAQIEQLGQPLPRGRIKINFDVVERELTRAQQDFADKLGAEILPPRLDWPDPPSEPDTLIDYDFGFDPIALPITIHGGVVLRAPDASREPAALATTMLWPDGRPLFRVGADDSLHFWNFTQPGWAARDASAGEHLEIQGGKVIARYTEDGELRFVIEGKQLSARHEVRFPPGDTAGTAVEWSRSLAVRGAARDDGQLVTVMSGALRYVAGMSWERVAETDLPLDDLRIAIAQLDADLWVVEVGAPYTEIRTDLEGRHATAVRRHDGGELARLVASAARWGVRDLAARWSRELENRHLAPESVDTLYALGLGGRALDAESLRPFAHDEIAWFADPANDHQPSAAVAQHLDGMAELLQRQPPAHARDDHRIAATALRRAAAATADRRRKALLEERARRYERSALIAGALEDGPR